MLHADVHYCSSHPSIFLSEDPPLGHPHPTLAWRRTPASPDTSCLKKS